jgi:hypothetical protein
MTIGVVTVKTSREYFKKVAAINLEYQKRTGFRPSLSAPKYYQICNLCGRVKAECLCSKYYTK